MQTCISCINGERKMKVNSTAKFEKHSLFKPLSQNVEILTPRKDDINSKMGQKGHIGISCNNIDRWKSRVEGTFRRIIHLQNFSLKVLKF